MRMVARKIYDFLNIMYDEIDLEAFYKHYETESDEIVERNLIIFEALKNDNVLLGIYKNMILDYELAYLIYELEIYNLFDFKSLDSLFTISQLKRFSIVNIMPVISKIVGWKFSEYTSDLFDKETFEKKYLYSIEAKLENIFRHPQFTKAVAYKKNYDKELDFINTYIVSYFIYIFCKRVSIALSTYDKTTLMELESLNRSFAFENDRRFNYIEDDIDCITELEVAYNIYEEYVYNLEALAKSNNVEALLQIANMYERGETVDYDPEKALLYYKKALKLGDSRVANKVKELEKILFYNDY